MKNKCKNPRCDCDSCECIIDGSVCTCGLGEYEMSIIEQLLADLGEARERMEDSEQRATEYLNRVKYEKAEFENYKKRERIGTENAFLDGKNHVIVNILPLMDALTQALKVVTGDENRSGLQMLRRKFEGILTTIGLEEIDGSPGVKFDPHIHNSVAVETVQGKESGIVLEQWQKGYRLNGRVVRPSSVKVSG